MKNNFLVLVVISVLIFCSFRIINIKNDNGAEGKSPWPEIKKEMNPWTRWWWMGSAVDEKNLDKLLTTYSKAGFGGVEITPIYGAKEFEKSYISFLSPQWMNMLSFTVKKASSLGMGVDMNTGTGWPFGGPQVTNEDAASKLIIQTYALEGGKSFDEKIVLKDQKQVQAGAKLQAVTAYGEQGEIISLSDKVDDAGKLNWTSPAGKWELYSAFCGKTLQKVKRAAPGGEGFVMDHMDKKAVNNYLKRFDSAFKGKDPGVRAFFNDSYEVYNADWSAGIFDEFKKRKGYDLSLHLKQLNRSDSSENVIRVKSDYREVLSLMLLENLAVNWTNWAHKYKSLTRYQAHGSPGNLLDLYAASDIPECEAYFGISPFRIPGLRHDTADVKNPNSNPNIFKFASSAANVYGKPLVSSETFVWLTDHFKTALSRCKPEVERLFLAGINHVFFHGTTYSPDDIPFPGWQFYASSNFTPANSLWPHLSGLNNYITRCQSVLQAGRADNELLIYWPVYDAMANPKGTDVHFGMHNANEWLNKTSFNQAVTKLKKRGYSLDYVSDKILRNSAVKDGKISAPAAGYKALIIPACQLMPVETLQKIVELAQNGATVIFEDFPVDVPGHYDLVKRRNTFNEILVSNEILSRLKFRKGGDEPRQLKIGKGKIFLSGDVESALSMAGINREEFADHGLQFIRRGIDKGKYYYLVNHTANPVESSIALNVEAGSVVIMDPQSGAFGMAQSRFQNGKTYVRVQMQPGEALILRSYSGNPPQLPAWKYLDKYQQPVAIKGEWKLHFTQGGPELPADQKLTELTSWTELQDEKAIAFSGSGEYTINFDLPRKDASEYLLDLGQVNESAHVWINGQDVGILWSIPFKARVGKYLKQGSNTIKIEVVNLMANRVRDLDIKGVKWRNYHEINFVNINYKPFDASKWQPQSSGLIGPVTITHVD